TTVRGSGAYVAADLPEEPPRTTPGALEIGAYDHAPAPQLSARGRETAAVRLGLRAPSAVPFEPSLPDVTLFPLATWTQLTAQEWREHGDAFLRQNDPRGFEPLRAAIAEYAHAARYVSCGAVQVIVTAGAQQAIDLAGRLLLDAGDRAWVEDPGYPAIRELFRACGARVVPVPLDDEGMILPDVPASEAPRLIAVAPSHQYPSGVTMSLRRRLALLEYAERVGAWIVEDDYDSEFRYEGRPLAALQGLSVSASARVVYVGTFSKTLFPAIRLGYLIVPKHLARGAARARVVFDLMPSIAAQPTLARFIADGGLASHVRRMRRIYRARRDALMRALAVEASDLLLAEPDPAGMHLVTRFAPQLARRHDDRSASALLRAEGLNVQPLSQYYAEAAAEVGFLLGYACAPEADLEAAVTRMVTILRRT
ncbi:MAG: PLP-dependent aminotransferase family protein, partial [Vulcanimicrobiaceae bacterium]